MINDVVNSIKVKVGAFEALGKNMFYEFATDRVFRKDADTFVLVASYQAPIQRAYQIPAYQ